MTTKHQRAMKAARAAKRLPVVGLTVSVAPLIEAASGTINLAQITSIPAWKNFLGEIIHRYTGVPQGGSGTIDAPVLLQTYLPIAAYLIARKTGISKPISHALGRIGLRF
jgi:hypothetical protein